MTWAPCPHGVRTRGKKNAEQTFQQVASARHPTKANTAEALVEPGDFQLCGWMG